MSDRARCDIPDINVLIALHYPDHEFHRTALSWLQHTSRFATTTITELGLLRLLLNPAVVRQRLDGSFALEVLNRVRSDARHEFIADVPTLSEPVIDLAGLAGHAQVTDLHLLNLAAAHGARLVTFDRRLARLVPGLDSGTVMTL